MNFITIGVGGLALAYGIVSAILRVTKPSLFKKLEPMKRFYGPTIGGIIHAIGYIIIPFAIGVIFLVSGILGKSI